MGFFVKDCTVSDNEGRSHDIISDSCADRATASSLYFDKGMRLILRRQYEGVQFLVQKIFCRFWPRV